MIVTHLGHACVLLDTGRSRLLIDPGIMSSFEDVTDVDAVLITHQHRDHIDLGRLIAVMRANPSAELVVDPDTASVVDGLPEHVVAATGDRFTLGGTTVDVLGGLHAPVYGDVPGCTNAGYLVDDGAFFHPGDSFHVPRQDVDVLAVAIDGPWLKISDAIDYVNAVSPRIAVPVHEGETVDPDKYSGMLAGFCADGVVRPLPHRQNVSV